MISAEHAALVAPSVESFADRTGLILEVESHEVVTDLLANLRHWCDLNHVNFKQALEDAEAHYQAERGK